MFESVDNNDDSEQWIREDSNEEWPNVDPENIPSKVNHMFKNVGFTCSVPNVVEETVALSPDPADRLPRRAVNHCFEEGTTVLMQ